MSEGRSMGAITREDAELSLLLDEGFAGAISAEAARRLLAELQAARRAQAKLNRRCQQAESIIAKSKVVENRPRHGQGRSFGRALANYAAAEAARKLEEALGLLERALGELDNIAKANSREWGEMKDQFEPWAKNRARHTHEELSAKMREVRG